MKTVEKYRGYPFYDKQSADSSVMPWRELTVVLTGSIRLARRFERGIARPAFSRVERPAAAPRTDRLKSLTNSPREPRAGSFRPTLCRAGHNRQAPDQQTDEGRAIQDATYNIGSTLDSL